MFRSQARIVVAVAVGVLSSLLAPPAFARRGPSPVPRVVLPVTSGAQEMSHTLALSGIHLEPRSNGAAPYSDASRGTPPLPWRSLPGAPTGGVPDGAAKLAPPGHPIAIMRDPFARTVAASSGPGVTTTTSLPVPLPVGAVQIDSTYYDLQDMGSLGQRIVIGADERVHVVWEDDHCNVAGECPPNPAAPIPYPDRAMGYAYRDADGVWHNLGRVGDPSLACSVCAPQYSGGFGTVAVDAQGKAVVAQHMQEDGCDERGDVYVESGAGAPGWMGYLPPFADFLFPQAVSLPNGSIVQMAEIPLTPPYNPPYTGTREFEVCRVAAQGQHFTCPTGYNMSAWTGGATQVAPTSLFHSSGHPAFPCLASASDGRVGIAVTDFGGNVYLIESSDGTFAPSTKTIRTLTYYTDASIVKSDSTSQEWRPYIHCHLAYQDTTPHVVWSELQARRIGGNVEVFDWRSRIRHWSSTGGVTTVKQVLPGEADSYDNIDRGLHGPLAGFNTISVDWPEIGFSTDGTETYVAWLRFTDGEVDTSAVEATLRGIQTGTGYGDIACSVQRGGPWSEPQNLTQTPNTDERFVSIATRNSGGRVHIVFQASATNQAGVFVAGDRGGQNCGPGGCTPEGLVRRIAYLERRMNASLVSVGELHAPRVAGLRAWPNPARGAVRLSATGTGRRGPAVLVFTVTGRRVARLVGGRDERTWSGRDDAGHPVPSGLYFARFEGDASAPGTKFMLLR